ncbi:hypothetical protein TNCV_4299291 [Trichonephila clavipes]|nr:hypothetical protein TNCV_4299291 [Trichonephila clavipes]
MATMTEKSFCVLEYARFFRLFRCNAHLEIAKEKRRHQTLCDGIINFRTQVFLAYKEMKQPAKHLERSSGEGEDEFCSKPTRQAACGRREMSPKAIFKILGKKIQVALFEIDTANNRGRKVSICRELRTIDSVMLQNVGNEMD